MAQLLSKQGFTNLSGIDRSANMVAAAQSTGLYQQIEQLELGIEPLPTKM
jgi:predicted TPR repeat methyltransferase